MPNPRIEKFEELLGNVQYWRYGPGIVDVDIRMGIDKVKDAQVGDSYRFEYSVHGSHGTWRPVEKL